MQPSLAALHSNELEWKREQDKEFERRLLHGGRLEAPWGANKKKTERKQKETNNFSCVCDCDAFNMKLHKEY